MDKTSDRISVSNNYFSLWKKEVLIQVDGKIASLKKRVRYQKVSSVLKRKDVIDCLSEIHTNFVIVPLIRLLIKLHLFANTIMLKLF